MKAKVGVLLSGCGYQDGSEIHEAVLTLLALDEAGADVVCMAPDMPQRQVTNHLTGDAMSESRNVLIESARIARGQIVDVADVAADELDALIIPGGFGAALNLSDFAMAGTDMQVQPDVAQLIQAVHAASKPIGAICIAPAVMAKLIPGAHLTIGTDAGTAAALEALGAHHENRPVTDVLIDDTNKIISTPAYMLGPWVAQVAQGIRTCVKEVLARI
jgi:enhancing lycopene biosynthesis protein 2